MKRLIAILLCGLWTLTADAVVVVQNPWTWLAAGEATPWAPPCYSELRLWYAFETSTNALGKYTNSATPPVYPIPLQWDLLPSAAPAMPTYVAPASPASGFLSFDGGDTAVTTFQVGSWTSMNASVLGPTNQGILTNLSFTMSAWVRSDVTTGDILYYYQGWDQATERYRFRYGGTYDGDTNFTSQAIGMGDNVATVLRCGPAQAAFTGKWEHVVWVATPRAGASLASYALYTNGVVSPVVNTNGTMYYVDNRMVLGCYRTVLNYPFSGDIDEVMGWATNLTPTEILDLYTEQKKGHL